jgi:hypothetical protein
MTTNIAKRFNKDGIEVPNIGPMLDGETIRVPMTMMDAVHDALLRGQIVADTVEVRHSPGYAFPALTDAELVNSEAAQAARRKALSEAWKKAPQKPAVPPFKKDEAPATDVESLLQARDARLTSAWATPPAPLPALSTAADTLTTPPAVPDVAAALALRDSRLQNAWRAA